MPVTDVYSCYPWLQAAEESSEESDDEEEDSDEESEEEEADKMEVDAAPVKSELPLAL